MCGVSEVLKDIEGMDVTVGLEDEYQVAAVIKLIIIIAFK